MATDILELFFVQRDKSRVTDHVEVFIVTAGTVPRIHGAGKYRLDRRARVWIHGTINSALQMHQVIGVDPQQVARLTSFRGGIPIASKDFKTGFLELFIDRVPVSFRTDLVRFDENLHVDPEPVSLNQAVNHLLAA